MSMRSVKQIAYNRSNRANKAIKYIVVHDTGNTSKGAGAENHYNYFNGGNRGSSADFFVDDKQIMCVNDYKKYYTWHCGDGRGKYGITNSNSVGVEMCINSDGDRQKTLENTVKVVKELMKELNIPIERVVRHYDASRKLCPATMSDNNWAEWYEFKKRLQNEEVLTMAQYEELKQLIESMKPRVYNTIDEIPEWARPAIQCLIDKGALKGTNKGLNLTEDMVRMLVIIDRTGVFK